MPDRIKRTEQKLRRALRGTEEEHNMLFNLRAMFSTAYRFKRTNKKLRRVMLHVHVSFLAGMLLFVAAAILLPQWPAYPIRLLSVLPVIAALIYQIVYFTKKLKWRFPAKGVCEDGWVVSFFGIMLMEVSLIVFVLMPWPLAG